MLLNNKEDYNKLCDEHGVSILQYWEWGEIKKGQWRPIRFSLDGYPISILVRKVPIVGGEFGYVPRVFSNKIPEKGLVQKLIVASKELGLTHLLIEPQVTNEYRKDFIELGFDISGTSIQPNQTNVVDLNATEEELWMKLKGKYRRNIKKAQRDGCKVTSYTSGDEAVQRFYKIMEVIFSRTSYVMSGYSYFQKVWSTLSEAGKAKIFIAEVNGKDMGAYLVTYDNNYAYEFYGGVTNEGRNYEAGYILKWEAIKDSRSIGKKFYDHWGVAPISENGYMHSHELYNISLFKAGFGGDNIIYIPQLVYTFKPFNHMVYKLADFGRKFLLKIKKRS